MSKKDVDNYFSKVCQDYKELVDTLHEIEDAVNQGLLHPDKLEQIKSLVKVSKLNWERISYIMYLLNKPTKKKKYNRYNSQNRLNIEQNLSVIHEEHKNNINQIRNVVKDI